MLGLSLLCSGFSSLIASLNHLGPGQTRWGWGGGWWEGNSSTIRALEFRGGYIIQEGPVSSSQLSERGSMALPRVPTRPSSPSSSLLSVPAPRACGRYHAGSQAANGAPARSPAMSVKRRHCQGEREREREREALRERERG